MFGARGPPILPQRIVMSFGLTLILLMNLSLIQDKNPHDTMVPMIPIGHEHLLCLSCFPKRMYSIPTTTPECPHGQQRQLQTPPTRKLVIPYKVINLPSLALWLPIKGVGPNDIVFYNVS
jgi:hypothetical protein